MSSVIDKNCTFLISTEKSGTVPQEEICKDLESSDVPAKIRFVAIYREVASLHLQGIKKCNHWSLGW
jgi:hypothetical protein